MTNKKVLIVGNKPYENFKFDDIIDSFDIIYRCNLAWPDNNNGTKFGRLAMCDHIYLNFVSKSLSKKEIFDLYGSGYDNAYLSDWYDWFQSNKPNFEEIFHMAYNTSQWNSILSSYGCPHQVTRIPRTGFSTIFKALSESTESHSSSEVFVCCFSLSGDEFRKSFGLKDETAKAEGQGCHDKNNEVNILTWLHNNQKVDASLCMLTDTEEPTLQTDNMQPSPFILDLINKK